MISEPILIGLISAASAIAGGVVSGLFNYWTSAQGKNINQYKKSLRTACEDIIAFYKIEGVYAEMLATPDRNAESIRRETRKNLRAAGVSTPSEEATPLKCERKISDLDCG